MSRFVVLAFWIACSGDGEEGRNSGKGGKKPDPVTVVEVEAAGRGEVAETLHASAVVESERAASLFPSAAGVVLAIQADEGDVVRKGDVLAVLDNVSLDAGAERARSELTRLEEQVGQLEELARRGAVSDRELEDARWQLQSARTSAREASRSYGQTRITAPFDGVIARRNVRVGELASGGAAAFEVVDLTHLRVVASLPERDLPRVALGQPASLVSAYDPASVAAGHVARIAPIVDAGSGTFRVTIDLDADQSALRPGQFVSIDLEVDRRRDVLVVPKRAILYEDGSPVVFVKAEAEADDLAEDGKEEPKDAGFLAGFFGGGEAAKPGEDAPEGPRFVARRTPVSLGLVDAAHAEILGGLEGGEAVVVLGHSHLRDGARVRTPDEVPVKDAAATVEDDDGDGA